VRSANFKDTPSFVALIDSRRISRVSATTARLDTEPQLRRNSLGLPELPAKMADSGRKGGQQWNVIDGFAWRGKYLLAGTFTKCTAVLKTRYWL
jgi:hypothetical protein